MLAKRLVLILGVMLQLAEESTSCVQPYFPVRTILNGCYTLPGADSPQEGRRSLKQHVRFCWHLLSSHQLWSARGGLIGIMAAEVGLMNKFFMCQGPQHDLGL